MSESARPYDRGAQPERTLLAWRRTALSITVASAVLVRLAAEEYGLTAVLIGAFGIALSLFSYFAASLRYRQVHDQLCGSDQYRTSGWPQLSLMVATAALGLVALGYLAARLL